MLIVSASDSFNNALTDLLPITDYWPVSTVKSTAAARRAMLERVYDLIVVNTPLPDEYGSHFAIAEGKLYLLDEAEGVFRPV